MLVVFGLLATLYARPWQTAGRSGNGELAGATLDELERRIAQGSASASVWNAYGRRLYDARQFSLAAQAYQKVIEIEPYDRPARFQCALSFASANETEGLLAFLRSQVHVEPKLVAELLDRTELQAFLADARFTALQAEARAQAMD